MKRVTGIGGIFFKAKDPVALRAWYHQHLGIDVQEWGGAAFRWTDADGNPMAGTTIWTVATSDASNGSVNGGLDAQTPAGGAVPLVNLFLGEVIFGGVGSGLYGMFFYILIAVLAAVREQIGSTKPQAPTSKEALNPKHQTRRSERVSRVWQPSARV